MRMDPEMEENSSGEEGEIPIFGHLQQTLCENVLSRDENGQVQNFESVEELYRVIWKTRACVEQLRITIFHQPNQEITIAEHAQYAALIKSTVAFLELNVSPLIYNFVDKYGHEEIKKLPVKKDLKKCFKILRQLLESYNL